MLQIIPCHTKINFILPTFQQRVEQKNTKKYNFFERMKFLFNQGDRNLFKISPQTRRLEMC